jgi:prophage antirepressor-like protein
MYIRRVWEEQEPYLSASDLVAVLKEYRNDLEYHEEETKTLETLIGIFEFLLVVDEPV